MPRLYNNGSAIILAKLKLILKAIMKKTDNTEAISKHKNETTTE